MIGLMESPRFGVAVNIVRCKDQAIPRWPLDDQSMVELRYMRPVRIPSHIGLRLIKKWPNSVKFISPAVFAKRFGHKPPIFIARSMGIGDILMLTPALRMLSEEGWEVHLAVLDAFTELVQLNPHIAQVIPCGPNEMPRTEISSKLNLNMRVERMRGRQWKTPRAKLFEELVGVEVPPGKRKPILVLDKKWKARARRLVPADAIAVCVETSSEHRNYARTQELVYELVNRGRKVVLLHHKKTLDIKDKNVIDLQAKISVGVMCAVIERCAALVSPDSGPMHVALTLGTPVVAIEGPTPPEIYHWSYNGAPKCVLQKKLKCIGCWHNGIFAQCAEHGYADHECMDWPPGEVADAAERIARIPEDEKADA
jgi:ADP-heptose:LPS heptosyltransferase